MKKILAMLLAVALAACFFSACDNGEEPNPSENTQNTTTAPSDTKLTIPTFTTTPQNDGKVTYIVTVLDQNNDPVVGVEVQFCDEENCKMPVLTDANGKVSATYAPAEYHITLVSLPEGYTAEETVFYFGDETELTVLVNAQ